MKNRKLLGSNGEDIAENFLKAHGCTILNRNYRCKFGEIDIIAKEGKTIVFIEVKTRRSNRFGVPEEAVDYRKQKRLRLLASTYLAKYFSLSHPCRFDVYAITLDNSDNLPTIRVLENCF